MENKIKINSSWSTIPLNQPHCLHIPNKVTIHHQGGSDEHPKILQQQFFSGVKTLKAIQNFHMKSRGWKNIGYHAIIAPNGDIYQGRMFDIVGAHVKSNNTGNIGIMLIGNFEVEKPTDAQLKSLKELLRYLQVRFPTLTLPDCLYGHMDFNNTDCPGKNLYPIVLDIKHCKIPLYEQGE